MFLGLLIEKRISSPTGDQILEWNRISMVDVTFEEAKTIVDGSHEKVAVIIYHNPTWY